MSQSNYIWFFHTRYSQNAWNVMQCLPFFLTHVQHSIPFLRSLSTNNENKNCT